MSVGEIFVSFLIWLLFYFCLALYYHNNVRFQVNEDPAVEAKEKRENFKDFQEFRTGICGCFEYRSIAFWSCFCPGIRWADTVSQIGLYKYYSAFWIMIFLWGLMWIPVAT